MAWDFLPQKHCSSQGKNKVRERAKPTLAVQRKPAQLFLPVRPLALCRTTLAVQTETGTHTCSSHCQQNGSLKGSVKPNGRALSLDSVCLASKQKKSLKPKNSPGSIFCIPSSAEHISWTILYFVASRKNFSVKLQDKHV